MTDNERALLSILNDLTTSIHNLQCRMKVVEDFLVINRKEGLERPGDHLGD